MGRFGIVIAVIELLLLVVAIVDIVLIDPSRVRGLPKWAWAIICVLLAIVGPLLWFFVGRERLEPRNHGRYATEGAAAAPRSGPRAPDDDPDFLDRLSREQQQEQRIRDLERRLKDLDDPDKPKPAE
jgi:hypothetical protein